MRGESEEGVRVEGGEMKDNDASPGEEEGFLATLGRTVLFM